jgi:hypothetical protein
LKWMFAAFAPDHNFDLSAVCNFFFKFFCYHRELFVPSKSTKSPVISIRILNFEHICEGNNDLYDIWLKFYLISCISFFKSHHWKVNSCINICTYIYRIEICLSEQEKAGIKIRLETNIIYHNKLLIWMHRTNKISWLISSGAAEHVEFSILKLLQLLVQLLNCSVQNLCSNLNPTEN